MSQAPTPPDLIARYQVSRGKSFRLKDFDPSDTAGMDSKEPAHQALAHGIAQLQEQQQRLYAQDRWALLLIFQAMDGAGKDGTIAHVMSGLSPKGCEVHSFKAPSDDELDHDYLWRALWRLPERGRIGIFHRSYYEEVLVVRVHPEILAAQRLPRGLVSDRIWDERFEDIKAVERYLSRNGVAIRKFFLHISKEEQRKRFLARLDEGEKNWKFSVADVAEREHWGAYQNAYEEMIRATATEYAPWYVIPADHKWFTRMVVAMAVVETLDGLDLRLPPIDAKHRAGLEAARKLLAREKG
jgi:PPK2 family polyphosphate:nucleotide phosphotransferase